MIERVLQERIEQYRPRNAVEQERVLAESLQQYVLVALARARLFQQAMFHGGTCLRIMYGTSRFSEDLDFLLKEPSLEFEWQPYLEVVDSFCSGEGIGFEIQDKSEISGAVKKAFLKTDSIGKVLVLELPHSRDPRRKIRIKLEIDTNPPHGSSFETRYIHFPTVAAITTQTLESGFATKSHALLCRQYAKGRDWYDMLWYIQKAIRPDLDLLRNALVQVGPWAGRELEVTKEWLLRALRDRIEGLDWGEVRRDILGFLPDSEQPILEVWGADYFLYQVEQLAQIL